MQEPQNRKKTILFLIAEDWYFWSHRLPIARGAKNQGFDVIIATRVNHHKEHIEKEGFKLIPINIERRSKNIIKEIITIIKIIKVYRREKPDIVHHVAVKPILYGSIAAHITGCSCIVNALAGLGYLFIAKGLKASAVRWMIVHAYRMAFSGKNVYGIFQNPQDYELFVNAGILKRDKAILIRGAGVDTSKFISNPEPQGIPTVVLASRMLWDKGVGEFVAAAHQLKKEGLQFRAVLVGNPDPENPASIPEKKLKSWHALDIIEWWGLRNDMPDVFAQSNIIVLPSYREGLPKVLLEAASCGRAIVATDVPGCREIVRHNVNGLLVPPNNVKELADAIKILIEEPLLRASMGARGREIVVTEFSEEIVTWQTIELYKKMVGKNASS